MFEIGFSQMLLRNLVTRAIPGVVTDVSILKPNEAEAGRSPRSARATLAEAGLIDGVFECPVSSSLLETTNYCCATIAALISSGSDIVGMLIRANGIRRVCTDHLAECIVQFPEMVKADNVCY